jgi:glutamate-1-semialdehyde aminotransferase
MRNLPIQGVQKNLKNSSFVFDYNNFDQLKEIISQNNIGTVVMEVSRNELPKKNFLENVRKLTKNKNIVLIFDECTSGFRETFGGMHLKYKIKPDIATFGKALGNGYAINAVIGTDSVMNYANSTFISSTFWTERIGSAAALKTLDIMYKTKSWKLISKIGKIIKRRWKNISKKTKVNIKIQGLDSMPNFVFLSKHHNKYKTFISQEMLKKNIIATTTIYVSVSHNNIILNKYFKLLKEIFKKIQMCESGIIKVLDLLDGEESIKGLRSK